MTKNGFAVLGSIVHLIERVTLWERYLDPEFRELASKTSERTPLGPGRTLGGELANPGLQNRVPKGSYNLVTSE